jgi:hypothetical protein
MSEAIPAFIQKVAGTIGIDGKVHVEDYTHDARDYRIILEPRVRKFWGIRDPEAWRERGVRDGYHQLVFRHLHCWGDAWMCSLEELRRSYTHSIYSEDDEDQQPSTPEAAFAEMVSNLVEEIDLLTAIRDSLRGLT